MDNSSGDEAMPLVPSDQTGPGFNELMATKAEEVWKLCLAGLPIGAVIYYTIGMYDVLYFTSSAGDSSSVSAPFLS